MHKDSNTNLLKQLPTKWAIAVVLVAIVYGLAQPLLNARLGWSLPSIASLVGNEAPQAKDARSENGPASAESETKKKASEAPSSVQSRNQKDEGSKLSQQKSSVAAGGASNTSTSYGGADREGTKGKVPGESKSNPSRGPPEKSSRSDNSANPNEGLRYGILKSLGSERYISPGGLVYARGSQEGHRLKHIERHLADQPNRPGSHGVFYGDMTQVLRWLDDTFERAKARKKGTRRKEEGDRTVFEAPFSKPVGYVGGQTGKRKGNPDARNIRLVVEGKNVITAFPY